MIVSSWGVYQGSYYVGFVARGIPYVPTAMRAGFSRHNKHRRVLAVVMVVIVVIRSGGRHWLVVCH